MQVIEMKQTAQVAGGEVGATGMGDNLSYAGYTDVQAKACADAIVAWGGLGGILAGFVGGISAGIGTLAGGAMAANYSNSCRVVRVR